MRTLLILFLLSSPAWATFTKIQSARNTACAVGSTSCAITVSSTGTGNLGILFLTTGSGGVDIPISSVSGGGTWALVAGAACHINNTYNEDCAYVLSTSSGATTITVTYPTATNGAQAEFIEYSYTAGPISYDTAAVQNNASCTTTCAGVALTLTGTNDVIAQSTIGSPNASAISGSYTQPADFASGIGWAGAINTASGAAPNWTLSGTGHMIFAAIAFKEAGGGGHKPIIIQ